MRYSQSLANRLSATRSPLRIARAGPSITATTAGTSATAVPSSSVASTCTAGSRARKTGGPVGTPHTTPGSSSRSSARHARPRHERERRRVARADVLRQGARWMSFCASSSIAAPAPDPVPGRTTKWPASVSLETGKSARKWTPRLSSRISPVAAISRTSGCCESSSLTSPSALLISPASRQSAAPGSSASPIGEASASKRGPWRAARPARRPKTRHSSRELEASRFAPCTPVHAHSPAAYSPDTDVARRGLRRCRRSRSERRGRPGPARRPGRSPLLRASPSGSDTDRADRPWRSSRAPALRRPRARRRPAAQARRRSARRRRRAASHRRREAPREQEAVGGRSRPQRRRVELDELEVGERGAGGLREQKTVADRAAGVGRPGPRPRTRRSRGHQQAGAERGKRCADPLALDQPDPGMLRGVPLVRTSAMWRPVSAPPACTTRAWEWPPSRPSPSSNATPSRRSSAIRAGASSVSSRTALGRQSPRPAVSVSAACSCGSSSGPTAAATPPWAA